MIFCSIKRKTDLLGWAGSGERHFNNFLQIISFLLKKKIINLWSVKWRWLAFALQWSDCFADFFVVSKECRRVPFSTEIWEIYAWWPPAKEKNSMIRRLSWRRELTNGLFSGWIQAQIRRPKAWTSLVGSGCGLYYGWFTKPTSINFIFYHINSKNSSIIFFHLLSYWWYSDQWNNFFLSI